MMCKKLLPLFNSTARMIRVLLLSLPIVAVMPAYASEPPEKPGFASIVSTVAPSVVSVQVTEKPQRPASEFAPSRSLGRLVQAAWQQPGAMSRKSLGSGFIIDPTGYIVTSAKNVANAGQIKVSLSDGRQYDAVVTARDLPSDLALLKITAEEALPAVQWGDSSKLRVGDQVLAIGDPFGIGESVTAGILSARGRAVQDADYVAFLQIDAASNPGDAGGPIVDLDGKVVGINTAVVSPNGANIGLGFAIPSATARTVIDQLQNTGTVARGYIGVECEALTPDLAPSFGLSATHATGALVLNVTPGSPAATAGMKIGDVIDTFAGTTVRDVSRISRQVADLPVGSPVDVKVLRYGRPITLHATIGQLAPENPVSTDSADDTGIGSHQDALGLVLAPLDANLRQSLGLSSRFVGAIIVSVADNSTAANAGLSTGDVIEQVDSHIARNSFEAAQQIFYDVRNVPSKPVLLLVNRAGTERFVAVPIGQPRG